VAEPEVARAGQLEDPVKLGTLDIDPPVVLAPMAGVTNAAFRTLCREQGAGLYVCEMITSRGLVESDETTLSMLAFDPGESVRSVQLYGVDPTTMARAAQILCAEYGVAHIDMNFGCPVPKVTRKGGGAALPWKRRLLASILEATVAAAAPYGVPVTMKTRLGIDADHLTYLEAGAIAQEAGCAAIALHARTAAQHYSGEADWSAIAELVEAVDIPVLGNGDIWEPSDAVRMMVSTGCEGVVVGRGCLGRPWLFRDLAASLRTSSGRKSPLERPEIVPREGEDVPATAQTLPSLGEVAAMMRRHAELLVQYMGEERGCKEFRKHIAWYLKGFAAGGELRHSLGLVDTLTTLDALLSRLDPDEPFPAAELGNPRGRQGSPRRVALPVGWLDDRDDLAVDAGAEMDASGG
jgi:nifR3 family TIM-barrel protein